MKVSDKLLEDKLKLEKQLAEIEGKIRKQSLRRPGDWLMYVSEHSTKVIMHITGEKKNCPGAFYANVWSFYRGSFSFHQKLLIYDTDRDVINARSISDGEAKQKIEMLMKERMNYDFRLIDIMH